MNSACIIAACAAHARNNTIKPVTQQLTEDLEVYFTVKFRYYLHFNQIKTVKPNKVKMDIFNNSAYTDMSIICPVDIPATTLAEERQFTVRKSRCPKGPDAFIKEHLEEFAQSGIWLLSRDKLVYKYIDDVQRQYGILLDKSAVDFSTQFCWEIL